MRTIHKLRLKKRMSLVSLGRKAGITPSYLSQLENGKRNNPSLPLLNSLAKELEVPIEILLRDFSDINI